MTIRIYGDSYATRYDGHIFNNETGDLWYDIVTDFLEEHTINYGKGGTGPYTSMSIFYKHLENNIFEENDKIVFMLSSQYRIPHTFLDRVYRGVPHHDHIVNVLRDGQETETSALFVNEYSYEIFYLYETLKEHIDRFNISSVFSLKQISQFKNLKTIVFMCFSHNDLKKKEFFNVNSYNLEYLNDENFYFYPKNLEEVVLNESIYKKQIDTFENNRANHISWENHKILANIIINFFAKTEFDEKFKENFLTIQPTKDNNSFLYE